MILLIIHKYLYLDQQGAPASGPLVKKEGKTEITRSAVAVVLRRAKLRARLIHYMFHVRLILGFPARQCHSYDGFGPQWITVLEKMTKHWAKWT